MQKLLTIVVPVYKVEKYLDKCVQSLLNQTYKNIEIILVDDGSPDNCGQMCDEYAAKEWIDNSWMYVLDEDYYDDIADKQDYISFLHKAFGVLKLTEKNFYQKKDYHVLCYKHMF